MPFLFLPACGGGLDYSRERIYAFLRADNIRPYDHIR